MYTLRLELEGFPKPQQVSVYLKDFIAPAARALQCLVTRARIGDKSFAEVYGSGATSRQRLSFTGVGIDDQGTVRVLGTIAGQCTTLTLTLAQGCEAADPARIVQEMTAPAECPKIEE